MHRMAEWTTEEETSPREPTSALPTTFTRDATPSTLSMLNILVSQFNVVAGHDPGGEDV